MGKRKKEKVNIIEEVQIKDFEHAKRMVTLAKINQIRIFIGLLFALPATILTLIGLFGEPAEPFMMYGIAMILAIPAYIIGGGIGSALKIAWNITKCGWFLIPVFPADVLIAIACFIFSVFGLLLVPIIFVGLNFIQHKKTLDAAKSYLAQCGYAVSSIEE